MRQILVSNRCDANDTFLRSTRRVYIFIIMRDATSVTRVRSLSSRHFMSTRSAILAFATAVDKAQFRQLRVPLLLFKFENSNK